MQFKQGHHLAEKRKEVLYVYIQKYNCQKNCKETPSYLYAIFIEFCRKQCYLYNMELETLFLLEFSLNRVMQKQTKFVSGSGRAKKKNKKEEMGN